MTRRRFLSTLAAPALAAQASAARPNIVVILVDDMGFSDIGCYGSEIPTPNIDRLADNGLRFRQFYNTARCCPTRASLLTGLHPAQTGVGGMTNTPKAEDNDRGVDGFQGYLNQHCVTMAEVLRDAGYHTYMSGKWHLGYHDVSRWPLRRGFERYYGIIAGASSYFDPQWPRGLARGNQKVQPEGDSYYTTDAFTDYAVRFLEEQSDDDPFFLYLAYNAPHWPLHAKQQDIRKFVGKYRRGWDELRIERWRRMIEIGVVEESWGLSERDPGARAWDELTVEQQEQLDYRMAVYAAQISCIDQNVGKLLDSLERSDKLDDTLILFLSDNGGCAEPYTDLGGQDFSRINDPSVSGNVSYGQGWANASNTPFRLFKVWLHEGGVSTPLIAHWPAQTREQRGRVSDEPGYLIDLMATVLEVSGAEYPRKRNGDWIHPIEGKSLTPVFRTGARERHEWMFWEHVNHCAVRKGDWKAIQDLREEGEWELYDVRRDRCEMHDRAAERPELVAEMAREWYAWAWRTRVFPRGKRARTTG